MRFWPRGLLAQFIGEGDLSPCHPSDLPPVFGTPPNQILAEILASRRLDHERTQPA